MRDRISKSITTRHRVAWSMAVNAAALLGTSCSDDEPTGPAANDPPTAEITTPPSDSGTNDSEYVYDDFDDSEGMWYSDVELVGSALDAEDGALSGSSLVWTTDRSDLQDESLGTGSNLTVRLYSDDCFGVWHEITLTATDSGGETASDVRRIFIWTVC